MTSKKEGETMFAYVPMYRKVAAAFVALFGLIIGADVAMAGGRIYGSDPYNGRTGWETTASATVVVEVPTCAEDEPYLQGYGDFDGDKWSHYRCVHIDSI